MRRRYINEAATQDSDMFVVTPNELIWNDTFFIYDIEEAMDDPYPPDVSVPYYYGQKNLPENDLKVKKIFVSKEEFQDEDEFTVDDLIDAISSRQMIIEDFGVQLANGDYLFTYATHYTGAAWIKCRDFESMRDYVCGNKRYGDGDIIEESYRPASRTRRYHR